MNHYFRACCFILYLFACFNTPVIASDNTVQNMSTEIASQHFQKQFQPLSERIYDSEALFSGFAMSKELADLQPLVDKIGQQSEAAARLAFMQAVVFRKRALPNELLPFAQQALSLDRLLPPYYTNAQRTNEYALFAYVLMDEEMIDEALSFSKHSVFLLDKDSTNTPPHQALIIRGQHGYLLHGAGLFNRAKEYNRTLLRHQDALQGQGIAQDNWLKERQKVLTNLAQNTYELKQYKEASDYLSQRRALLQGNKRFLPELIDSYFQLGVLASEMGNLKEAQSHFDNMLETAIQSHDDFEIEQAKERIQYWQKNHQ